MSNITYDIRGELTKRNGYTALNTGGALGDVPNGRYVTGGGYHDTVTGQDFFVVIAGTNVYRTTNTFGTTYTTVTGTVTITAASTNLAQHTGLNDKIIFCNETDRPFYVGVAGNALAIETTVVSSATTCATNNSYLIFGNTIEASVAYPTRIRWSDIANQNNFPANNYIDIEPNDGDKIVAIISYEDRTFIFKKRSVYELLLTGDSGANAFIYRSVARNIGAWAKNSVQVIPNVGIVFLAQNTIYTLNGSNLEPIGDAIQTTLSSLNRTKWKDAVGVVYPKRYQYWLAMSEDSNPPQLVLVYDYILKAWTEYRFGTSVTMMAQAEDSTGANIVLMGDTTGYVYKQDIGTADYPLNTKTVIVSSYTTADLSMGSPEVTKNFKYLYLYSNVTSSSTITLETALDFATTFDPPQNIQVGNVGAVYDTAVYDTDMYTSQKASITRIDLNQSGKVIKLRFSNATMDTELSLMGWIIVYSAENINE